MNRIDRLFSMLTLLQAKKYVPAEKIADRFNISVRTVYRDIKALCESGIPVSFEQQKGYFIVQGYFLPPVAFTTEEANALLLTEALVAGFADRSIKTHYSSALHKVKAVLRTGQKDNMEALSGNIRLQVPDRIYNNADHLATLQHAIAARQIVHITYTNNSEEASKRNVEPIGLIFYAFSWHLIGWCHMRHQYRDFKVQRITTVTETGQPFRIKEHMPLGDYMKQLPVSY
ncbi:helix-turn-helix transcriptional regulator [Sediminibacterium ginsengisoli]|uniref:HTH domain-containing protein n=1 Tax=Sediminibacterium ginsengisoli TaxID=413434 RepID=A0A1T4KZ20_9BACT|nr:YafY family protein [Sediminibacterium ginsengisoli]SJZ47679.1 HTH domain-containing protein [Sediminibacterium ginsengisoli]